MLDKNTYNHSTVGKLIFTGLFKILPANYQLTNHIYIYIYIYKQDLVLNNQRRLICHKIQPTKKLIIVYKRLLFSLYTFLSHQFQLMFFHWSLRDKTPQLYRFFSFWSISTLLKFGLARFVRWFPTLPSSFHGLWGPFQERQLQLDHCHLQVSQLS